MKICVYAGPTCLQQKQVKPRKSIYLLFLLSWTGLIVYIAQTITHRAKFNFVLLVGLSATVIYFSYFCYSRFTFDGLPTRTIKRLSGIIEIPQNGDMLVCEIDSGHSIKLRIKLSCKHYQPDDKFQIRVLDHTNSMVLEDAYIPIFGKFNVETQILHGNFPLTVRIFNGDTPPKTIAYEIEYAEIA